MEIDKALLLQEIPEFHQEGKRFLNREITAAEFKAKSGGFGVYAQRGGEQFMIRLRTPSGVLSTKHLGMINKYCREYGLEKVHLTTRQAVQLHDLTIDAVCAIMEDAVRGDLFTRGGGGNFPRNVALSPLAGVMKGEPFDVTPFALQAGQYLMSRITQYRLPRKLKVAFSNGAKDTANATLCDIGFVADLEQGEPCFRLYLAGGMGHGPAFGIYYDEPVKPEEILYHIEAMTRLFVEEGDYEHKATARTRFIPRRMGEGAFLDCYRAHLAKVKAEMRFDGLKAVIEHEKQWTCNLEESCCLIAQKQEGKFIVILHPVNGQMPLALLEKLEAFCKNDTNIELRLSMEQEIYVRNLVAEEAQKLMEQMAPVLAKAPVEQSVSCIGVPTCQMGIEQSQALLRDILSALRQRGLEKDTLPPIHISGCPNSCSRHQVSAIGFAGRKKKIDGEMMDCFNLFLGGGHAASKPRMGEDMGLLRDRDIPSFLCELAALLKEKQVSFSQAWEESQEEIRTLASNYVLKLEP